MKIFYWSFCFCNFNLISLFFTFIYIIPEIICVNEANGNQKMFHKAVFVLYCCTIVKFRMTQNSLLKNRLDILKKYSWWKYLRETFDVNRDCQLTTWATVYGIYFQGSLKCCDSLAELIKPHYLFLCLFTWLHYSFYVYITV